MDSIGSLLDLGEYGEETSDEEEVITAPKLDSETAAPQASKDTVTTPADKMVPIAPVPARYEVVIQPYVKRDPAAPSPTVGVLTTESAPGPAPSQAVSLVNDDDDSGSDSAGVDERLMADLTRFFELRRAGRLVNKELAIKHSFRNPNLLSKLVQYYDLEEYGTNFAKHVLDLKSFSKADFFDELAQQQKQQELQNQSRQGGPERNRLHFVTAGIERQPFFGVMAKEAGGAARRPDQQGDHPPVPQRSSGVKRSRWSDAAR